LSYQFQFVVCAHHDQSVNARLDGACVLHGDIKHLFGAKWLELLKEIAPSVTRVGVIRYAANPAGIAAFGAIQNAAQSLGLR